MDHAHVVTGRVEDAVGGFDLLPLTEILSDWSIVSGDFSIHLQLQLERLAGSGAAVMLGADSALVLDGPDRLMVTRGPLFGDDDGPVGSSVERWTLHESHNVAVTRRGRRIAMTIDGEEVAHTWWVGEIPRFGVRSGKGTLRLLGMEVLGRLSPAERPLEPAYSIPLLDISGDARRRVIVDREEGQYLGHPTTVLLEDDRTMLCAYPKGHGRGPICLKRSPDGGRTWGERLPVPPNFATSKETPTIHRVVDRAGNRRLILFSGLYPIRMASSDDDGETWTPLAPIGDFGGIVAMSSVAPLRAPGEYIALFHDDGRFFKGTDRRIGFRVYATRSRDGGLTWGDPYVIAEHPVAHLCEPGLIRSPDGRQMAVLLRENSRRFNSFVIFSDDEGRTWTPPRQVPASLTGDRHVGRYAPDGRLFITFRDTTRESSTQGDWVGWVGSYEDLVHGRDGICRVRLMDNKHRWDCAYPGLELLPDGTFVTTTYGHWTEDEPPYVVSVRFKLADLDRLLRLSRRAG